MTPEKSALMQQPRRYLAHAARDVFADRTWWKKALVGSVVELVPILGWMVVLGYNATWLRQTAWRADDGLPRLGNLGEYFREGWRAFVIRFVWGLLGGVFLLLFACPVVGVLVAIGPLLRASKASGYAVLAVLVLLYFAYAIALLTLQIAAIARGTLYQRISAGTDFSAVRRMIRFDFAGFRSAALASIVSDTIYFAAALVLDVPYLVLTRSLHPLPASVRLVGYASAPLLYFILVTTNAVAFRAYGLWIRDVGPTRLQDADRVYERLSAKPHLVPGSDFIWEDPTSASALEPAVVSRQRDRLAQKKARARAQRLRRWRVRRRRRA